MEFISLLVQITIIYLGLFFLTDNDEELVKFSSFKWVMFGMVLIPSWSFLAYFILKIRIEAINYASEKQSNILFKIFSCGLIKNKEEFIKVQRRLARSEDSVTDENSDHSQ